MNISAWVQELPREEKGYVRQCWHQWNCGGKDPSVPEGISGVKAQLLKYHTKSFIIEGSRRKRKMEDLRVVSFKMSPAEFDELAKNAAQIDVNVSVFIRCCIELGTPQILINPKLINFFSESVIPK
jgi:hypothetical protein